MNPPIEHKADSGCFETVVDGHRGVAEYRMDGDVMEITHTEVASELGGRGIAGALMQAALDHARKHGLKVRPACSYAQTYMERHPETAALRA